MPFVFGLDSGVYYVSLTVLIFRSFVLLAQLSLNNSPGLL